MKRSKAGDIAERLHLRTYHSLYLLKIQVYTFTCKKELLPSPSPGRFLEKLSMKAHVRLARRIMTPFPYQLSLACAAMFKVRGREGKGLWFTTDAPPGITSEQHACVQTGRMHLYRKTIVWLARPWTYRIDPRPRGPTVYSRTLDPAARCRPL